MFCVDRALVPQDRSHHSRFRPIEWMGRQKERADHMTYMSLYGQKNPRARLIGRPLGRGVRRRFDGATSRFALVFSGKGTSRDEPED